MSFQLDDGAFERLQPMLTSQGQVAPRSVVAALLSFGLTPTEGVAVSTADDSVSTWQVVALAGRFLLVVTAQAPGYEWHWHHGDRGIEVKSNIVADCYPVDSIERMTVSGPQVYVDGYPGQQAKLDWYVGGWALTIKGRSEPIELPGAPDDRVADFCRALIEHSHTTEL